MKPQYKTHGTLRCDACTHYSKNCPNPKPAHPQMVFRVCEYSKSEVERKRHCDLFEPCRKGR